VLILVIAATAVVSHLISPVPAHCSAWPSRSSQPSSRSAGWSSYLNRHGLEAFGWYRIAIAGVVAVLLLTGAI
jgi:hypothetical protein